MHIEQSIYPYAPQLSQLPFLLTGIGGSSFQGHVDRPNGYQWHQILYCAKGRGALKWGSRTAELVEDTFVFLPKGRQHEYYPLTNSWEVDWIAFDGAACETVLGQFEMKDVIIAQTDSPSYMCDIFERMYTSQKTDILYSDHTCSGLVYDYIIGFRRLFATDADNRRSKQLSMLIPALKYMYDNYSEDIPMTFLAKLTGVTHQHFCRLFKSTMRMRPNDYLISRRLEEAKRMLSETEMPVSGISAACGFRDAGYFSTVFRRSVGASPAVYRKNCRNA